MEDEKENAKYCYMVNVIVSELQAEVNRLRTALAESEKRCEIAEKGIAQKNAEPIGKKPKFKVGDKVRITYNVPYWKHNGKVLVIKLIADDCKYALFGIPGLFEEQCLTLYVGPLAGELVEQQTAPLYEDIEKAFDVATKEEINGQTYILESDVKCILLLAKYCGMSLDLYQDRAMGTCMPSCENFTYMLTELNAEVGEINDKIAKWRRKGIASIKDNHLVFSTSSLDETREYQTELALELGDALWAIAGLAHILGFNLETVGRMNIDKLADRKRRGVIDGTGDNR